MDSEVRHVVRVGVFVLALDNNKSRDRSLVGNNFCNKKKIYKYTPTLTHTYTGRLSKSNLRFLCGVVVPSTFTTSVWWS